MTITDLLAGRGLQAELSSLRRRRAVPRARRMAVASAPITYRENDVCVDDLTQIIPDRPRRRPRH